MVLFLAVGLVTVNAATVHMREEIPLHAAASAYFPTPPNPTGKNSAVCTHPNPLDDQVASS